MELWAAPRGEHPVDADVVLPGSKSQTNRALVLAAVASEPSALTGALWARDTELMADALTALGVTIERDGDRCIVRPATLRAARIETGLAGTVMRFVPPIAALADGPVHFDGDPYARERPMATLLDGLRQAGVSVDDAGRGGLPFTVHGVCAVPGGRVCIDASASSQFVSGLLLAGARYEQGLDLVHSGTTGTVPSAPHVAMTVEMLRHAGVTAAETSPGVWRVEPGPVRGRDWAIEPDLSNAAPFLAAAVVTGGRITVPRWPKVTTQAGDALRDLLAAMGADVHLDDDGLTVSGAGGLRGLDADLHEVGELTPTLVALAALASSPSTLRGIGHLRGHETDRLAALAAEVNGLGGDVTQLDDGLKIRPRRLHGGTWHAYADHRMATAGAVVGLAVSNVSVEDIASTTKTMPDFVGMWTRMLEH